MQCTRACWRSAEQAPVPGARLLWLWGRGGDRELGGLQTGSPQCTWPPSSGVTRELGKVTGCQALPHPRGRAVDGCSHENMRSPDPCGLVPGSPCGWRASRRSPEAVLLARMAQNHGRSYGWTSVAGHLGTCPLLVSQRWVWFLEPTDEKHKRHKKPRDSFEGVAGRPPAEIRGVRVPHACPECDSCRSAVCKVCVVRDLCCVQGLPLPHPAILPTL